MYQSSYAEVLEDNAATTRRDEHDALDRAVELLKAAKASAPRSSAEHLALTYVNQLWAFFIKSLAAPDNDLPKPLRASLMSIGLGVLAEANRIELGQSRDFDGIADICGIVRDGLA